MPQKTAAPDSERRGVFYHFARAASTAGGRADHGDQPRRQLAQPCAATARLSRWERNAGSQPKRLSGSRGGGGSNHPPAG
jgi:hypothetical protein